jgi:hypothetical protein
MRHPAREHARMGNAQCIPSSITAGDTVAWSRTLADYPAGAGWSLKYKLVGASGAYAIDATVSADGNAYAVVLDAATTAAWTTGNYQLQEYVTNGSGERHTLGVSALKVLPDLAAASGGMDLRTSPQRILDAINAVLEGRATSADLKVQINGRSIEYIPLSELLALRSAMKLEVLNAQRAAGNADTGKLLVRFVA